MVDQSNLDKNTILMADRGYESYNVLAHIEEKGWKYIVRIKDTTSKGMASTFKLPDDEFDKNIYRELTRKQTKEVKAHPELYKFLPINSTFDYLDLHKIYKITISHPLSKRLCIPCFFFGIIIFTF